MLQRFFSLNYNRIKLLNYKMEYMKYHYSKDYIFNDLFNQIKAKENILCIFRRVNMDGKCDTDVAPQISLSENIGKYINKNITSKKTIIYYKAKVYSIYINGKSYSIMSDSTPNKSTVVSDIITALDPLVAPTKGSFDISIHGSPYVLFDKGDIIENSCEGFDVYPSDNIYVFAYGKEEIKIASAEDNCRASFAYNAISYKIKKFIKITNNKGMLLEPDDNLNSNEKFSVFESYAPISFNDPLNKNKNMFLCFDTKKDVYKYIVENGYNVDSIAFQGLNIEKLPQETVFDDQIKDNQFINIVFQQENSLSKNGGAKTQNLLLYDEKGTEMKIEIRNNETIKDFEERLKEEYATQNIVLSYNDGKGISPCKRCMELTNQNIKVTGITFENNLISQTANEIILKKSSTEDISELNREIRILKKVNQLFQQKLMKQKAKNSCSDLYLGENDFLEIFPQEMIQQNDAKKVYKVERNRTNKDLLVMKVFTSTKVKDMKYFIREFEMMKDIGEHPCLFKIMGFSYGGEKRPPTMLSKYYPLTLPKMFTDEENTLNDTEKVMIIIEIVFGMIFIQEKQQIIHRNLHPEIIFLTKNKHVRIGDFGKATIIDTADTSLTKEIGTPLFMAPELLTGDNYTNKVDQYAFGLIIYYILMNGKLPNHGFNEIAKGHMFQIPKEITKLGSDIIFECCSNCEEERPSFTSILEKIKENDYDILPNIDKEAIEERITYLSMKEQFLFNN